MNNHKNAVEALIYLADCSAATCEHMACLKSIHKSEFDRHVGITRIALMAAYKYRKDQEYEKEIQDAQRRLDDAIQVEDLKIKAKATK